MPKLIESPTRIPVPGGKVIDEYVGRARTGSSEVSVAHMVAPAGWNEPAQAPEFQEITLVLRGRLTLEHEGGTTQVSAGQAVLTEAGERVRYSTDNQETEYVAICRPAFDPELAHRDEG
jgi:quercetin dioxygenase-like cupin family protein